jgi:hypothetical protein
VVVQRYTVAYNDDTVEDLLILLLPPENTLCAKMVAIKLGWEFLFTDLRNVHCAKVIP